MSRDFILILAGGLVSLVTTLVVLFVSDYIYRRDELLYRKSLPPPKVPVEPAVSSSESHAEDEQVELEETLVVPAQRVSAPAISMLEEGKPELIAQPEAVASAVPSGDEANDDLPEMEEMSPVVTPTPGRNGGSQSEVVAATVAPSDGKNITLTQPEAMNSNDAPSNGKSGESQPEAMKPTAAPKDGKNAEPIPPEAKKVRTPKKAQID